MIIHLKNYQRYLFNKRKVNIVYYAPRLESATVFACVSCGAERSVKIAINNRNIK